MGEYAASGTSITRTTSSGVRRNGATLQHGGRVTCRTLAASPALVGSSDWPGPQQALRVERRVVHKATGTVLRAEVAYAATAVRPQRADPAQLLALWRQHRSIENRLHDIRDTAFDEDRATARAGHAPQVMAACRNAAIGRIRALGTPRIAAACRIFAAQPLAALLATGARPDLE